MKFNYLNLRNTVFILLATILFTSSMTAQKKPTAVKLDVDIDDKQLCESSGKGGGESRIRKSEFCDYYNEYNKSETTNDRKKAIRNEMIDLVSGQIDTYYKLRKDGRSTKIRWFQTLLDFLEIGASTAISITNGERAKTVVGIALNGFQGGRTVFNKNFEILQTQVLINKMNSNRAQILTEIITKKDSDVDNYSWYAAKNDLRRYLLAGTFNNALDTLVKETGAEAEQAEQALLEVGPQKLTSSATLSDADLAEKSRPIKADLRKKLKGTAEEKATALKKIKSIVEKLEADDAIQKLLEEKQITSESSNGEAMLNALRDIIIAQTSEGRAGRDIVAKINRAFTEIE